MNKYLRKGFIQVFIGISLCFIAPITISQAFNNQDHPFFIIVLIIGITNFPDRMININY